MVLLLDVNLFNAFLMRPPLDAFLRSRVDAASSSESSYLTDTESESVLETSSGSSGTTFAPSLHAEPEIF